MNERWVSGQQIVTEWKQINTPTHLKVYELHKVISIQMLNRI